MGRQLASRQTSRGLEKIVPAALQSLSKQKYLQYFGSRTFYATAGYQGAHAARMLRMFYLAPVGSLVISTGQASALEVGKISSAVKYQDNGIDLEGHADEDYVREVDEWIMLDVPLSRFTKPIRGRLFHPYAVLKFPQTLFGQFVATIATEKGQAIAKKVEGLL